MGKRKNGRSNNMNGNKKVKSFAELRQRSAHDSSDKKLALRLQMKTKLLNKALQKAKTPSERARLHYDIALYMRAKHHGACEDNLRSALKEDESDEVCARHTLVMVLLDQCHCDKARAVLDQYLTDTSAVFAWSRALIEFISHRVLEEEGSSEQMVSEALDHALTTNPHVGAFIGYEEAFTHVVKPDYVEGLSRELTSTGGSVDEAFSYCVDGLSMWLDADGGKEFVREKWVAHGNDGDEGDDGDDGEGKEKDHKEGGDEEEEGGAAGKEDDEDDEVIGSVKSVELYWSALQMVFQDEDPEAEEADEECPQLVEEGG